MNGFLNWVMNTPMVSTGLTVVVVVFTVTMMVYSTVYSVSNGRNGQMKSPTAVAIFGVVGGGITLFIGLVSTYLMVEILHLFS